MKLLVNRNHQDNFLQAGGRLQELTVCVIYLPVLNATVSLLLLFELPDCGLNASISSPDILDQYHIYSKDHTPTVPEHFH